MNRTVVLSACVSVHAVLHLYVPKRYFVITKIEKYHSGVLGLAKISQCAVSSLRGPGNTVEASFEVAKRTKVGHVSESREQKWLRSNQERRCIVSTTAGIG
ncbi:uncharacterized protein LAESUDRAFT_205833 [Laetiporus sulphureus 93-53]|uniref:Uncharacterized protein n=1 Tax=Laetiporus sulphureus 93-53 TaxID=1314785 RepID=A0A165DYV2_9APHY|nr:uncharacterized protein LAESUDRAFT_205833 [Laetiporus sulphureus 93-53]KZT05911.1 hypothetical protein LAESUDRAFT_205833 [Laetiporus sulphureus 93-53]